jgi:hypothetical protein
VLPELLLSEVEFVYHTHRSSAIKKALPFDRTCPYITGCGLFFAYQGFLLYICSTQIASRGYHSLLDGKRVGLPQVRRLRRWHPELGRKRRPFP